MKEYLNYVVQNRLLVFSLAAVGLGIAFGLIVKTYVPLSHVDNLTYVMAFPGEILMQMFQLLTIPIIVTSLVRGLSTGPSIETSPKIAKGAAVYFIFTTLMSVSLGLVLVLLLKPGVSHTADHDEAEDEKQFCTIYDILDLLRNIMPPNLVQASYQQYKTEKQEFESHAVESNSSHESNETELHLVGEYVDGTNTLGLIICSVVTGLALKTMGESGEILLDVFTTLNEITKYVVNLILWYVPFGLLFLITNHVVGAHDWNTAYSLVKFMALVVIGLIIHGAIVLPTIYLLLVRRSPWPVIKGVSPALMSAVRLSSSSATLPLILQCCEERNRIDRRITRFMLPIGANVNMDGTALYAVMAAVFIAQLNDITLDLSQTLTIGATSALSTTGTAGLPSTGAVTTFFILSAASLPAKEACILVLVEWLLDHCNTGVDVLGDCIGVALVHHLSGYKLEEMEGENQDMARTGTIQEP
ncbi:excitatory amino acid transporter 3-like [Centropristis striata]|uniref:excitatory amino acid transporter 3-like n=1 Tax=Centropristis striata TaxID=184440 RepID=UPI0027E132CE|nr:excitatory amino acid transporter 3-like [Centropristis striata]